MPETSQQTIQHTSSMKHAPVWAPDPSVPIAARILAYLFWGLMVLTLVRSCFNDRPPDTPRYPEEWLTYRTTEGITIPYPNHWQVESRVQDEQLDVFFFLPPLNAVRHEMIVLHLDQPADAEMMALLNKQLERKLGKELQGFTTVPWHSGYTPEGWHRFTARSEGARRIPLSGAWVSYAKDTQVVYLIAVAPTEGWPTMERIFTYMQMQIRM